MARHLKFRAGLDQILTKSNIRRSKTGEPLVLALRSRECRPKCANARRFLSDDEFREPVSIHPWRMNVKPRNEHGQHSQVVFLHGLDTGEQQRVLKYLAP